MERKVIFRDFQEQQAADHIDLQDFAQTSLDHLVADAVTASRRFAGFTCTKTAQAEVQVQGGRLYDANGAIYHRGSATTQSMLSYLAAAAKRIVVLSASGSVVDTQVEERDFLVNVQTGQTEPQSVATVRSRDAVLSFTSGAESADPQPPAIPATHVAVAHILLDTTQVIAVTMLPANEVSSTEELDQRTDVLEDWRTRTDPRISSLASDLAALSAEMRKKSATNDMSRIYEDLARIKERVEIPDTASDYGADRYLDTAESDAGDSQSLGYDAKIMEGIRFADANADEFELDVFAANDPNAMITSGLLLPAYDSVFKMGIYPFHSELGIAQYGFQTFEVRQRQIARERIRYGNEFTVCTNSAWWASGTYDSVTNTFRIGTETWTVIGGNPLQNHQWVRLQGYWIDRYIEEYQQNVVIDHTITGAQVAQSFLVANDFWMTRVRLWFTSKAANENVRLTITELTNGTPDLQKAIAHVTLAHASMVVGDWTSITFPPTFLKAGKRYALVVTSNANHKVAMAQGQNYLDGSFFYSTDGVYYQGDLTKDLCLELWGAKFRASSVTVELEALNLDGGIRAIDITAGSIKPESTDLIYEVQPGGTGEWQPLRPENMTAFNSAPPLARFRVRFVGTRDVQAGLMMAGSRVRLSRPKTAFKHISEQQTLAAPSGTITVKLLLENFDDTPHDCGCRLRVGAAWETADATVTTIINAADKRVERKFTFNVSPSISAFSIEITGSTNSAANTFHVAERVHWAA